ncbi:dysbindin-like [Cyprinodon tularosa]|uniref:dysbindin-like n=1 Tax=Cyprinodon tularosa TaxID=77115 RepID=UPI0018E275E3|nr:dysbindin-like [Cyprinodon tularosa]
MSSTGSTNHNKHLAPEKNHSQSFLNNDSAQHLKLKDRQRFFEEVYQHDMDNYLPSTHLQVDCRKPPMGSISSMEVNVDTLEQMDLMDISDQEALDVFLNSGSVGDEGALASPLPVIDCKNDEDEEDEEAEVVYKERAPLQRQNEVYRGSQSRFASTSSGSSVTSAGGAETPVIQSDDEEVHADTVLLTSVPCSRDEETEEEDEEEKCVSKTHQNN